MCFSHFISSLFFSLFFLGGGIFWHARLGRSAMIAYSHPLHQCLTSLFPSALLAALAFSREPPRGLEYISPCCLLYKTIPSILRSIKELGEIVISCHLRSLDSHVHSCEVRSELVVKGLLTPWSSDDIVLQAVKHFKHLVASPDIFIWG